MPASRLPEFVVVADEIAHALRRGLPVVALESAVISHGLPHPVGIETTSALEAEVRAAGAIPATVAVVDGRIVVGLDAAGYSRLTDSAVWKVAERDLAVAVTSRATGGTTVSATIAVAATVGVSVMSTGGIGGVHLDADWTWDVSADLQALARHSVIVVSAGAKAICDIGKTLEFLDTTGVTVAAYGSGRFPNFYVADSGFDAPRRIDRPAEAAAILRHKRALRQEGAVLVTNPIPAEDALTSDEVARAVAAAQARIGPLRGGDLTPALLAALGEISGGRTLRANVALLRANARLAAAIAREAAQESLRA